MLYNPGVTSNGTTRLRNVYRIQFVAKNVYLKSDHMVNPFESKRFNRMDPTNLKTRYNFCKSQFEITDLVKKLFRTFGRRRSY